MGYTHYWEYSPDDLNSVLIMTLCRDAMQVVDASGVFITGWSSKGTESPEFNPEGRLALNGYRDDGCETFSLDFYAPRPPRENDDPYVGFNYERYIKKNRRVWEFCKTNRRDYDSVVTAILLRAFDIFPKMDIRSDGTWEEWVKGRDLYFTVFGQEAICPWLDALAV